MGVPGVPWHPQILADQLTLSQPGSCQLSTPHFQWSEFQTFLRPCLGIDDCVQKWKGIGSNGPAHLANEKIKILGAASELSAKVSPFGPFSR